jgi:hypothetical protein
LEDPVQLEITCREVWREISNFLDGEVSAELRARLERHFGDCKHCSAILDGSRNTLTLVANGKAFELPAEVGKRMYARFREFLKR